MNNKAKIQKKYRLKKAIKDIVINHYETSYFLTITFNETTLQNTTKEQRLKLVKNYLNNQTDKYILNCDYGAKNGREHYHALTIANDKYINFTIFNANYGHIYSRPINLNKNQSKESQIKILLEHELKETSERVIHYSKAKRPNHKTKDKTYIKVSKQRNCLDSNYIKSNVLNKPINKDYLKFIKQEFEEQQDLIKETEKEEREKLHKLANDYLSFKRH